MAAFIAFRIGGGDGDTAGEPSREPGTTAGGEQATVRSITDGDTLRLTDGRRVRLVQIDAPEEDTECFGGQATAALAGLVSRQSAVRLVSDPALDGRDEHGRLLRYVVMGDLNVNLELVARGAAVPYFFRKERGRFADELERAREQAQDAKVGLWAACPGAQVDPYRGSLTGPR